MKKLTCTQFPIFRFLGNHKFLPFRKNFRKDQIFTPNVFTQSLIFRFSDYQILESSKFTNPNFSTFWKLPNFKSDVLTKSWHDRKVEKYTKLDFTIFRFNRFQVFLYPHKVLRKFLKFYLRTWNFFFGVRKVWSFFQNMSRNPGFGPPPGPPDFFSSES